MTWLAVHSLFVTILSLLFVFSQASATLLAILLAAEATVAFSWLIAKAGVTVRSAANTITSVRLVISIALLAAPAVGALSAGAALLWFGLAVVAELTDLIDGRVAAARGPTAFGRTLDAETDALFMLALSLFAVHFFDLPSWVIAAGLLRYVAALPFLFLPDPGFPRWFSLFAKTACAVAAVALVGVISPVLPSPDVRAATAAVAVALLAVSFGLEAVLRIRAVSGRSNSVTNLGLLRSVVTYHGIPFRHFSIRRFYSRFVSPGDLVFDIGAHVGNRVEALRSLGATVVAVEPQPACVGLLRRYYGADNEVVLVDAACGETEAVSTMSVSAAHPTLSTLSADWTRSINEHFEQSGVTWDQEIEVRTTTLDLLIQEHGEPVFIKIDVEGFESQVLAGLSVPVRTISFEFLPASIRGALESLALTEQLGDYEYNYSMVETMRFTAESWMEADELRTILEAMPPTGRSGDVYARLKTMNR